MKYLPLLSTVPVSLVALLAPSLVLAQRERAVYPTPEQAAALPRYVPPIGLPVMVIEPLPLELRVHTQRAAPETLSKKQRETPPRLPGPESGVATRLETLPDPLAGHPRPDTVTNKYRVENVKPQLSNPPRP